MKVGVLQFFSWPDRSVPLGTVYARALERIEVMDRTGYDAVWLAEHHFSGYSVCPSVHMMGTLAAARTSRLRIGMGVSLAAFYHPLRLAEEVALLDQISGGRVNWGAGRGFSSGEFAAFGIPPAESAARFREAVDIVLRAWTEERLSYDGQFFSCDAVEVLPKPLQAPHPPVWMAATSEPAIDWAAGAGFTILMDPHASFGELAAKRRFYDDRLAAAGHDPGGREIPMARLIALADDAATAEAVARRGAAWLTASYAGPQHKTVELAPRDLAGADPIDRYVGEVILHGTPEAVVEKIQALGDEVPMDYLLCAPLSQDSFRLLTEKVLPRIV
ncbi:MAG: LLM class flavin-dependent oxidoreductase [Sneathiellaceae bacterium]